LLMSLQFEKHEESKRKVGGSGLYQPKITEKVYDTVPHGDES